MSIFNNANGDVPVLPITIIGGLVSGATCLSLMLIFNDPASETDKPVEKAPVECVQKAPSEKPLYTNKLSPK